MIKTAQDTKSYKEQLKEALPGRLGQEFLLGAPGK